MKRTATLAGLISCVLLVVAAGAIAAHRIKGQTTLVSPAVGSAVSGQFSSIPKGMKNREVMIDIEPFVASTTPRQHPTTTTDASGNWQAPASLQDRYDVRATVLS